MADDREHTATLTAHGAFAPATSPRLLVFGAAAGQSAHPLPRGAAALVIGRAPDCEIKIDDASLSRAHARVHVDGDGRVTIEDLGSRNGTRVAGRALAAQERAPVAVGEAFNVGALVCVLEAPMPLAATSLPPARKAKSAPEKLDKREKLEKLEQLDVLVDLVAHSDISAVLFGETGVGKEVTARAIHARSARGAQPFVGINCAALPEALLESELFGYERGAFSGAVTAKPGLFESAAGGTVLLDEIGEMSAAMQAKLLRVLEERQVMRLGALKPKAIDVRFLSASHKALEQEVAAGRFRQDLFFRIAGITLTIPSLRERGRGEIERLARMFIDDASARSKRAAPSLTPAAVDVLAAHPWPGNVRELKNVIERALLLAQGAARIDMAHVVLDRAATTAATTAAPAQVPSGDGERERIVRALDDTAGNQSRAAELLGISRRTLVNKIVALGIARPRAGK